MNPGINSFSAPGFRTICKYLLVALMLALTFRHWIWMPVLIKGNSMLPTLRNGQILGLNKLAYVLSLPQRGDVVVISTGKELITKRIVGLPGEEVKVKDGQFYVEGKQLEEPYLSVPHFSNNIDEGRVQPGCFVVASDNRCHGSLVAVVSKSRIIGRIRTSQ